MIRVGRRVRQISGAEDEFNGRPAETVEKFRNAAAWVLLGEPGSGKSETFKAEAGATGGIHLTIAEFLNADPAPEWQGKTLFLDGLDEVRGGAGAESMLISLRRQLQRLSNPPFRVACRAADWFGSTDRDDLRGASPDGRLPILQFEPLAEDDVLDILRENHGVDDPRRFIEEARRHAIAPLLSNPKTLELIVDAIQGEHWPTTRDEVMQLACEKLATESSKRHRNAQRSGAFSHDRLLDAAGHLCAVLLLSDKTGVALDAERADKRYPTIEECAPPDLEAARHSVGTRLFRPEGEERVAPNHRSIAEYLASRWLAARIDRDQLPLGRILNLLLGRDGRTVAGLRGLYAWLALHSLMARARLLEADPLTAVIYGDVKPMPAPDKRLILQGLRREAERHAAFRWDARSSHRFGGLFSPELTDEFIAALTTAGRADSDQVFADCILDILDESDPLPRLEPVLKGVIEDASWWRAVRDDALKVWLKLATTEAAIALLHSITDGRLSDPDDELSGQLLRHLYPKAMSAEALLRHLRIPKTQNLVGRFVWFWEYDLPQKAPNRDVPVLLDALAADVDIPWPSDETFHFKRMLGKLLTRGLALQGDNVSDDRLFAWLGTGANEDGSLHRGDDGREIARWIEDRPERYKGLLALCYRKCEGHKEPGYCVHVEKARLHESVPPDDLGRWHLDQASATSGETLTRLHLDEAIAALSYQRSHRGLSLELIEQWAAEHPEHQEWLRSRLVWEIPEWRTAQASRKQIRRQQLQDRRRETAIRLSDHLPAISSGTANPALLHQLAAVWMGMYVDTSGNSPVERFDQYCENGPDFLAAAEAGFIRCPERPDLPSVEEIVDLAIKRHEHYVRLPCLVGMELCWRKGPHAVQTLSDDVLRRMVAFRLTYSADNTPEWFLWLVANRPALVADVLVEYAAPTLRKLEHVDSLYQLAHDPRYKDVAEIAVPALLDRFPTRVQAARLGYLEYLLKAALRYRMPALAGLLVKKTASPGLDVPQKVYWLAAGMLHDPERYEAALWRYVGKSWMRANHVSGFLSSPADGNNEEYRLSAAGLAKLVDLLAPHAELDWPRGGGTVTDPMRRGDHVRALVRRLGSMATDEAILELDRLLDQPSLRKLKFALEDARHQARLRQRESEFLFLPLADVAQVLANRAPASVPDLAALLLDHLDDIALEIRRENDDGIRAFWNVKGKQPLEQRDEENCRDALLTRLRPRLKPFDIDCQPEGDYANDKRADIRVSCGNRIELPIELKRDSNDSLWTALRSQLIGQYANAPKAAGHGVYLVLWFGGKNMPRPTDGGKRPRSPEELRSRLEATLAPEERTSVFVRLLDVSWPTT